MDEELFYSNFSYSPDVFYFLYVGELKNHDLNYYLQDVLARRLDRPVSFLSLVPDILSRYNYPNIVAHSPLLSTQRDMYGDHVSFRTDIKKFMEMVSNHPLILDIIEKILTHQNELFVSMFESMPEMTLDRLPGVVVLGPEKALARELNNKAVQLKLLQDEIPVVDFRLCSSFAELLDISEQLRAVWQDGIFVSRLYSAAGAASAITFSKTEIMDKFGDRNSAFLLSRYIPHTYDPTVLAVVAGEDEVYIAGVADQCIEGGNRFVGSTWPTVLPEELVDDLHRYTRRVGQVLACRGYHGIFGCDYIVDRENQVKFIEINARKQGTTLEFCYALEQILPAGSPSLLELEYCAVQEGRFPENTVEPPSVPSSAFCWGTYNHKISTKVLTTEQLPQHRHEREIFGKVARKELASEAVLLEHVGADQTVLPGTFLARTVAVGHDMQTVHTELRLAREKITHTIS